eukprot:GHVO01005200.1.p3 GENE.GHVO01005200.1~~GHVO01005200.1.p3  ORF type:complete len:116 (+),score=24.88 GHVO01005200.1:399-746(+)
MIQCMVYDTVHIVYDTVHKCMIQCMVYDTVHKVYDTYVMICFMPCRQSKAPRNAESWTTLMHRIQGCMCMIQGCGCMCGIYPIVCFTHACGGGSHLSQTRPLKKTRQKLQSAYIR